MCRRYHLTPREALLTPLAEIFALDAVASYADGLEPTGITYAELAALEADTPPTP